MATVLGKVIADFTTSLAASVSIGATTATLQSATDDDAQALAAGTYYFAIDADNNNKEYIRATLSGTALSAISSISRNGTVTAGFVRAHRVGASAVLTDFANLKLLTDLLTGATDLDSSDPLKYDGTATISDNAHLATKLYVDGVALSGAPDASTTQKGMAEEATQAEVDAGTAAGSAARLFQNPSTIRAKKYHDYAADAGGTDAYAITLSPVITAYSAGQVFTFKANTANTGAATLNVNALGAITIKKNYNSDLADGDIKANQIVTVVYDGTNMQLVSPVANPSTASTVQVFTASGTWNKPTGLVYAIVEVVGSGGGGAGAGTTNGNAGGGGGGGGYSKKRILAGALGSSETVTIGAVGTAGTSGANAGGTGGTSSFGAHCSATGGSGGSPSVGVSAEGGVGSSGDINANGGIGGPGSSGGAATQHPHGSYGGNSYFGGGARDHSDNTNRAGLAGTAYGGGGGGGYRASGDQAGAAGAAGIVIVTEYY